ncbi:MAG: DUF4184 family protein [Promethearchaeota archaeon]|jgi:hypothetical protein
MPNSIVAHQAPGLLLKMRYPKRIDGTAIYLGAFVPDLNVFFEPLKPFIGFPFRHVTHSLLGLIIWVAPITLLLTIIFSRHLGPRISNFVKKEGKIYKVTTYFGLDELHHLKKKKFNGRFYFTAFYSALIGGLTHLLLDLPAHKYNEFFFPWALFLVPDFLLIPVIELGISIHFYDFMWLIEDRILLGISIFLLGKIKKDKLIEKWYDNVIEI